MRYLTALFIVSILTIAPAKAMDGVVTDTGDIVSVDDGTTFSQDATVIIYDADGGPHDVQVVAATDNGDTVSVDVVDAETGDARTIEFTK